NQKPRSMPTRSFAMSDNNGARQSWNDGSQKRSDAVARLAFRATSRTATSNVYRIERRQNIPGLRQIPSQGRGPSHRKLNARQKRRRTEANCRSGISGYTEREKGQGKRDKGPEIDRCCRARISSKAGRMGW